MKRNVTLRNFAVAYGTGLVMGALMILTLQSPQPEPAAPATPEINWERVAYCVWERWDSGADMQPVVRFCYTFEGRL